MEESGEGNGPTKKKKEEEEKKRRKNYTKEYRTNKNQKKNRFQ